MIIGVARVDEAVKAPTLLRERVRAVAPLADKVLLTRPVATDPESMLPPRPELLVLDQHGHRLHAPQVTYGGPDELRRRMQEALPRGWADLLFDVSSGDLMPAT